MRGEICEGSTSLCTGMAPWQGVFVGADEEKGNCRACFLFMGHLDSIPPFRLHIPYGYPDCSRRIDRIKQIIGCLVRCLMSVFVRACKRRASGMLGVL